MNVDEDKLSRLLDRRKTLLREQASVAVEFNHWLTVKGGENPDEDGAIENSKKKCKNLEAAIVQARQPGYFEYHRRSRVVREMEKKNILKKLAARICQIEKQIKEVNDETEAIYAERRLALENHQAPQMSGLKDWFAKYGEPSKTMQEISGLKTEFVANPKVYGGTSHHKAFKSLAVTLKKGRMTR